MMVVKMSKRYYVHLSIKETLSSLFLAIIQNIGYILFGLIGLFIIILVFMYDLLTRLIDILHKITLYPVFNAILLLWFLFLLYNYII